MFTFILKFLIFSIIKGEIIIIPFKTMISNKLTQENFMSELINGKIYINLKIGTPPQEIPAILNLAQVPFFITSSSFTKNKINFNESKSSSYTQESNKTYSQNNYDYISSFLGQDIITIKNISKKDSSLNRIQFFLATNLTKENENITGEIGLNIIYPYFISFLNQLKDNSLIDNYIFSIKYNTENEGEFHLGNYYHLYDNNENYKGSDFNTMKIGIPRVSFDKWCLDFDKIILSNGNKTFLTSVELSYEFGPIMAHIIIIN